MKGRLALPVFVPAVLYAQGLNPPPSSSANFLAQLLHRGDLGWTAVLAGMAAAFGLGALHALSPGHGKTIAAAYLVGSRSNAGHAVLLGLIVTFTHTASVFCLGFATLFLSRFVLPEKIFPVMGAASGLLIVWIGGALFFRRLRLARRGPPRRLESRVMPGGETSLSNLMALGASGGLVPCPSALVLLLSSVALSRIGLGLALLVAFSTGLAIVLTAIGIAAVYARRLLPSADRATRGAAFRYLPVVSAAVIACVGMLMTAAALGLVRVAI